MEKFSSEVMHGLHGNSWNHRTSKARRARHSHGRWPASRVKLLLRRTHYRLLEIWLA